MIIDAVAANMASTVQIKEDYGSKGNRSVRLIEHRLPSLVILKNEDNVLRFRGKDQGNLSNKCFDSEVTKGMVTPFNHSNAKRFGLRKNRVVKLIDYGVISLGLLEGLNFISILNY